MKTRQRGRPTMTKELLSLTATHTEIVRDFQQLDCDSPLFTPKRLSPEENFEIKPRSQRYNKIALDGILGLASLMSDQDREEHKDVPADWLQPYPICNSISWDILPTGLPLQSKELMQASFDIYYQGRSQLEQQSLS